MKEKYVKLRKPEHPNSNNKGYIREHVFVMSEALGRPLRKGEVVHHIDNNPLNNDISNLMLFSSNAEHMAYHAKQRAYEETGSYDSLSCAYCKRYDDPVNMYVRKNTRQGWHRECASNYKSVKDPKTGPYKYQKDRNNEYGIQRVSE